MTTNPETAADRIRTYLRLLPSAHNLGGEIAYSEEFRSEDWPRSCYAPTREDVEALLSAVSVVPPATNQTAPVDRAAVLAEAAARYEEILANADTGQDPRYWTAVRDITLGLRAMAAEAPHTETPDEAPPREPHPTEADLRHALAVFGRFHGRDAEPPAVVAQPGKETDDPHTVCVCGHSRGEHVTVSGRLLCDECDPDSTSNLVCRGFEAL